MRAGGPRHVHEDRRPGCGRLPRAVRVAVRGRRPRRALLRARRRLDVGADEPLGGRARAARLTRSRPELERRHEHVPRARGLSLLVRGPRLHGRSRRDRPDGRQHRLLPARPLRRPRGGAAARRARDGLRRSFGPGEGDVEPRPALAAARARIGVRARLRGHRLRAPDRRTRRFQETRGRARARGALSERAVALARGVGPRADRQLGPGDGLLRRGLRGALEHDRNPDRVPRAARDREAQLRGARRVAVPARRRGARRLGRARVATRRALQGRDARAATRAGSARRAPTRHDPRRRAGPGDGAPARGELRREAPRTQP